MKNKRIITLAASLGLAALAAAPMGASAAYSADKQATGGTTTFDKYLVMESDATVPNTSFNFTIEAADATTDNIGGVLVFDGIAGVKFTSSSSTEDIVVNTDGSATVSFKPTDTTTNDVNAGTKTVSFADSVNNNEKFAMKTITIDFSDVKFPNPGIYCYKLTETAPTSGGITNVSGADYICYVSVEDSSGTLIFKDCYFQSGTAEPVFEDVYDTEDTLKVIGKKNTKKVTGVTNRYTTHNLDFNKVVEGNQGSRDKYFKFTVKLTNPAAGEDGHINVNVNDRYIISSQSSYDAAPEKNAATTYEADVMKAANATSIHTGEGDNPYKYVTYSELAAGKEFYIHSNQNIKILGIPDGLGYEISELQEDYTPAVNIRQNADNTLDNNGVIADAKNKVTDGALTADAEITFTNTKGGVIPTGILNTVAGSLCIAGLGAAGITVGVVMLKKKKSDDDSES